MASRLSCKFLTVPMVTNSEAGGKTLWDGKISSVKAKLKSNFIQQAWLVHLRC